MVVVVECNMTCRLPVAWIIAFKFVNVVFREKGGTEAALKRIKR